MKFALPDTCLEDYEKRRSMFLKELIASTPNVSVRAKEFRRWIDENSPYSDAESSSSLSRYEAGASVVAAKRPGGGSRRPGSHHSVEVQEAQQRPSIQNNSGLPQGHEQQ